MRLWLHPTNGNFSGDLSTANLRFLTSRQAIEDIANFIRGQNSQSRIENPCWVLVGGSYAGTLAAWSRQLNPELTVGAVASSAPMLPIVDFYRKCEDNMLEQLLRIPRRHRRCAAASRYQLSSPTEACFCQLCEATRVIGRSSYNRTALRAPGLDRQERQLHRTRIPVGVLSHPHGLQYSVLRFGRYTLRLAVFIRERLFRSRAHLQYDKGLRYTESDQTHRYR